MLKNITITISEEAASWARHKAAEQNTSISRLVGAMLERQMHQGDDYSEAYRHWTKLKAMNLDAANRLSRENSNARR